MRYTLSIVAALALGLGFVPPFEAQAQTEAARAPAGLGTGVPLAQSDHPVLEAIRLLPPVPAIGLGVVSLGAGGVLLYRSVPILVDVIRCEGSPQEFGAMLCPMMAPLILAGTFTGVMLVAGGVLLIRQGIRPQTSSRIAPSVGLGYEGRLHVGLRIGI